MPHVITDACIDVKDRSCVEACPADAIHPAPADGDAAYMEVKQLYIDPDSCIDCGACVPACPMQAIYPETELPDDKLEFIQINEDYYQKLG